MGTKELWLPSSVNTGGVALPTSAASEVEREQRQMIEEMDDVQGSLAYWTKELQHIFDDPHVKVVLAKPNTTVMGLKPNYYHIVRMRPGTAAWILPIETPDGGWKDLDSSAIEIALESDLWNDRTQKALRAAREKAEKARLAQKTRESQERAAEFDERLKSALNASISVPRSI